MICAGSMQPAILNHLRARRAQIRRNWVTLLRVEPVTTPLAEPEVLIHLFDCTLNRIFATLNSIPAEPLSPSCHCPCGLSPFLAYFRSAEQVLLEALVLVQKHHASDSNIEERTQDMTELQTVIRSIGREEITLFGSICQHRQQCETCWQCPQTATSATVLPILGHGLDVATRGA